MKIRSGASGKATPASNAEAQAYANSIRASPGRSPAADTCRSPSPAAPVAVTAPTGYNPHPALRGLLDPFDVLGRFSTLTTTETAARVNLMGRPLLTALSTQLDLLPIDPLLGAPPLSPAVFAEQIKGSVLTSLGGNGDSTVVEVFNNLSEVWTLAKQILPALQPGAPDASRERAINAFMPLCQQ